MCRQFNRRTAVDVLKFFAWVFALSFVVLFSWNMAVPEVFGLEPIRFKQAIGLVLLCATLASVFNLFAPREWKRTELGAKPEFPA